jgi:Uma2 family endonuclease
MSAVPGQRMSLQEYFEWEEHQPDRNEYHRGEIFAMVGARRAHGRVASNLDRRIGNQLDGSPCQVFHEGMKVQIAEDTVLYPDLFVTCNEADLKADLVFRSPILVLEVLSPTTQAYDRSHKFALYRRLDSLKEYILVDPDTRRVEAFRRNSSNEWVLRDMSTDDTMEAASINCRVPMVDVFAGIDPPQTA